MIFHSYKASVGSLHMGNSVAGLVLPQQGEGSS